MAGLLLEVLVEVAAVFVAAERNEVGRGEVRTLTKQTLSLGNAESDAPTAEIGAEDGAEILGEDGAADTQLGRYLIYAEVGREIALARQPVVDALLKKSKVGACVLLLGHRHDRDRRHVAFGIDHETRVGVVVHEAAHYQAIDHDDAALEESGLDISEAEHAERCHHAYREGHIEKALHPREPSGKFVVIDIFQMVQALAVCAVEVGAETGNLDGIDRQTDYATEHLRTLRTIDIQPHIERHDRSGKQQMADDEAHQAAAGRNEDDARRCKENCLKGRDAIPGYLLYLAGVVLGDGISAVAHCKQQTGYGHTDTGVAEAAPFALLRDVEEYKQEGIDKQ